ncbi:dipeptide/oligopeptide/nickel ABC transporter permease/ATP-binding protein [Dactylosporangium sp. NPDC000244]|uniref:dipeptide/oligopeptide/nickel ABC transporter permease/ATP-binding protein n=1 Tax=Dactylosporangium sp. NPDC000244 TaxID=3154365 RepID=UPI0033263118
MRHRLGRTLRTPVGLAAAVAVVFLVLVAVFGPMLLGARADAVDTDAINQNPGPGHLLGTDALGRDIAARVVVATRLSLELALGAAAIGVTGGVLLGVAPALVGRRLGRLLTAAVGILVAFPSLLFVLFLATIFGVGARGAMLAIGLALVPPMARLVQNLTASVAGSDYVAAARVLGVGRWRMMTRHLLPNVAEPCVLFAATATAGSLVAFAGLSFLGLGVQQPEYDWGRLLNEQLNRVYVNPLAALAPGAAVVVTGLMLALVGETLAQAGGRRAAGAVPKSGRASGTVTASRNIATDVDTLVEVRDLTVGFGVGRAAVRGVSFRIARGEAVGLVGESGSGKSLTALALADLLPVTATAAAGMMVVPKAGTETAVVFQDPMTSLNPALRVGRQLAEVAEVHRRATRRQAWRSAVERLAAVGIPTAERRARQRPHEYSGGMRQRAMIGMGLMGTPRLIIADEPTTALDVTVQRQVLDLLAQARRDSGAALLMISHDLGVVAQVCDRVLVMYAGVIVEELPVADLFTGARHPYTRALAHAVPTMSTDLEAELATIPGRPPQPGERIEGCPFAPRCASAEDRCRTEAPPTERRDDGEGSVACWFPVAARKEAIG